MQCDLWFPTPIWSVDLEINNNTIYNFCKTLQKTDQGREKSNRNGWQSNDFWPKDHPELETFQHLIYKYSAAALDCYKFDTTGRSLEIQNMWVNINDSKSDYNMTHIHSGSVLSGVYYVKCSENSGTLSFPRNEQEQYIINTIGTLKESNNFNYDIVKYFPTERKLMLFPSWIPHFVTNNQDEGERISISFNIGFY